MEIWKDIKGHEGVYQVSNLGRIKQLKKMTYNQWGKGYILKERIMSSTLSKKGYLKIGLRKDGKRITLYVHRIVITAFIPNPENKITVNHKDGIKTNNNLDNLEWNTHSENNFHYHAMRRLGRKSPWVGISGNMPNLVP